MPGFTPLEGILAVIAEKVTKPLLNSRIVPVFWKRLSGYKGYDFSEDRKTLVIECASARVSVSAFRDELFRIIVKFDSTRTTTFFDGEYFTFSVEREPECEPRVSETPFLLSISTGSASEIVFDKTSCIFSFIRRGIAGQPDTAEFVTNAEFSSGGKSWVRISTRTNRKLSFMGFGQKARGFFKNRLRMRMWNTDESTLGPKSDPLYQTWPVVLSGNSSGFDGWFFDNPHYQEFVTHSGIRVGRLSASACRGPACLYWTWGRDLSLVTEQLGRLLGTYSIPPLWALGHHHSRWEPDESADRIRGIAEDFRKRGIPCDAVHVDIGYMNGFRCFTWDRSRFADPEAFVQGLHERHFNIVVITDPGLKKDLEWNIYRDGKENHMFCRDLENNISHARVWPGVSAFPDFSDPEVRAWWGSLFKVHTNLGIDGFWIDMNEPAVFSARRTLPDKVLHRVGEKKEIRDHGSIHNLYALLMASATADGLRKLRPGMRQFIFSRAAYAGMQRWASTWTGDNRSNWDHLRLSIPMVLNLGLSGMPMTGPDIGGFWDAPTPELLVRWFAAGVFYPFHRNHTQNGSPPQEIWSFGPEIEKICAGFIKLRYAFLPYLYSLFYTAWKKGRPVMRPLVFHFSVEPECWEDRVADTEYLAGESVLLAPILWQGKTSRSIYFPGIFGTGNELSPVEWVCHRTHRVFSGGTTITENVPLEHVPLFVRSGSILPMSPGIMSTAEAFRGEIVLDIYPAKTMKGRIYLDDTKTEAFKHGEYSLFEINGAADDNIIKFHICRIEGDLSPAWAGISKIIVRIAGYGRTRVMRQLKVDNKVLSDAVFYNKEDWLCFDCKVSGADLWIEVEWS